MKNRKIVLVAFMLIAVMLLGIGFAELTDTLSINGTLETDITQSQNAFDDGLYISATSIVTDDTGNKAASQINEGRDEATITAHHFTTEGQTVVVKYTIKNDCTDFTATVTPAVANASVTVENGEEHDPIFSVSWSWSNTETDIAAKTLAPGESQDFWVKITLDVAPDAVHSATFAISFNAVGERA